VSEVYRQNLVRMLGGLIWIAVPAVLFLLFLPHEITIDYRMTPLLLLLILLVNFSAMFLPLKEGSSGRRFGLAVSLFGLSLIALLCAAIYYSGGIRSPLFTFLLLATAFSTSLFSSLTAAALISFVSVGAYLVTLLVFSGLHSEDIQTVCMQVFFLLLISFFINRMSVESREQASARARAMEELRSLSQMDRAASSFVSAVSFEMRTPLTSILGFSELLASMRLPPEKEREYVEIISREADNLSSLVEDLLDISRLESGKVQLSHEITSLEHLLDMSLPVLDPVCDPSRLFVNIPADLPAVMVDTQRMKRVFDSVFGYIVRRSGRGTELRASAKVEGREVVITLNMRNRDTARLRENGGRIFPPLGEPDKDDLELAMARRLVMAHQGSINLIQTSGGWFTIVLRLPELTGTDFVSSPPSSFGAFEERHN
jgi:signal transduction histidine kinase